MVSSFDKLSKNKSLVYNKLYINAIKIVFNRIDKKNKNVQFSEFLSILKKVANTRFIIENILNQLFPKLQLYENLDKFGRVRSDNLDVQNCGRKYAIQFISKIHYTPFNFLLPGNYIEPLVTPIAGKYEKYEAQVKSNSISNNNLDQLIIREPVIKLLYTYSPCGYTIKYDNIPLTSFYYELNDNLYNELKSIDIPDRKSISKDMIMYRTIYHTNPQYHLIILNIIYELFKKIMTNEKDISNYNTNVDLIKEIYWWMSHATLYERGSCAITEIFCNALFLHIDPFHNDIYFVNNNYNTDIEAMLIDNPADFINKFNNFVLYKDLYEIHKFIDIPLEQVMNIKSLDINTNYLLFDVFEYIQQCNIDDQNNTSLDDIMNEFK